VWEIPERSKVVLSSGRGRGIPVVIQSVRVKRVRELTEEDARADGFTSLQELADVLEWHYPGIQGSDVITILEFERA